MKKVQGKEKIDQVLDILSRITTRIEEATVDISGMKVDLKSVKLRLHTVEANTELTKIDVERLRVEIVKIGRSVDDVIETQTEILSKMVTQEELTNFSHRVRSLEKTLKAA